RSGRPLRRRLASRTETAPRSRHARLRPTAGRRGGGPAQPPSQKSDSTLTETSYGLCKPFVVALVLHPLGSYPEPNPARRGIGRERVPLSRFDGLWSGTLGLAGRGEST